MVTGVLDVAEGTYAVQFVHNGFPQVTGIRLRLRRYLIDASVTQLFVNYVHLVPCVVVAASRVDSCEYCIGIRQCVISA